MPSLGADMSAGTLVKWRCHVGDRVKHGDIIAEVETDKGIIEVEVFEDGVVHALLVEPGQRVPVGTPLAQIGTKERVSSEVVPSPSVAPVVEQATTSKRPPDAVRSTPSGRHLARELGVDLKGVHGTGRHDAVTAADVGHIASRESDTGHGAAFEGRAVRVSPLAKRRADELGIEWQHLQGSGPQGSVVVADVQAAVGAHQATPTQISPPDRMRGAIAAAMTRSKQEIPHYYVSETIDMHNALERLAQVNEGRSPGSILLPGVLLLRAVVVALGKFRDLNGYWKEGRAEHARSIDLGVAISLRSGGLIAPAIADAQRLSIDQLMAAMRDLVNRARAGALRSSELSRGSVTVTSLGERGVESVTPIIYPPQVAMVGFGKIDERPWVVDGSVVPRPLVTVTLAADHRVTDGHLGARFLSRVRDLLEGPDDSLMDGGE